MRTARVLALVAALLVSGCARLRGTTAPSRGAPSGREGWLVYTLEALQVQAPAAWKAESDGRRLLLAAPNGRARLEITVPATAFPDERACLADADQRLGSGAESLERVRRHPTKLAGRPGESLEADRGGWHVWAVAACDGGVQYRIFFTAENPAPADVVDVWRTLVQSARIGGEA